MRATTILIASCAAFAAGPSAANAAQLLVDMREPFFLRPPDLSEPELQRVLVAAAKGGEETTINGAVSGAFTAPGRKETLYVLQRGGPRAADPDTPAGVTLAVFNDGRLEARLTTDAGNFVQSTPDIDGDGVNEVLLRADNYQMGVATTRLSLVRVGHDHLTTIASFDEARVDRCGDARFGGDVEAEVIRYEPAAKPSFVVENYEGHCVDGEPPSADKFQQKSKSKGFP